MSLKVLVSGASGFLATWVVRAILEQGHSVRGTVRSTNKGEYLKKLYDGFGCGDNFEYVIVEDIEKDGAFDDAVKGMDAIVHTASPFHLRATDPDELIKPAVQGTLSILQSVLKHAPNVKRVVITSSTATVTQFGNPDDPPKVYNEKDWNMQSPNVIKEQGKASPPGHMYRASKTLAELAAWDFVEAHKNEIGWDLVTLQPPYIFGPIIHEVSSVSSLNTSSDMFFKFLKNEPPRTPASLAEPIGSYVDVRDVAWVHATVLTHDKVGGKDKEAALKEGKGRITLAAGEWSWQDVVDALNEASIPLPPTTAQGEKGAGKNAVAKIQVDSSYARNVLGLKFKTVGEVFGDSLEDFRKKGWIA